jgi:hypothetical protein
MALLLRSLPHCSSFPGEYEITLGTFGSLDIFGPHALTTSISLTEKLLLETEA